MEQNEEKQGKPQKTFVKSMLDFQNRLKFYEQIMICLGIMIIISGVMNFFMMLQEPIVILEKDGEKLSFQSYKKEVEVTEKEIKKLVENFIRRRFEWDKFSQEEMMAKLSPIVSSGLKAKIADDLEKESKTFKNDLFSQYVGKINVAIDEAHNIIGSFDKILRIQKKVTNSNGDLLPLEKIPLISEAQVMVKVIKGFKTGENPLGLYINGVINYEPR